MKAPIETWNILHISSFEWRYLWYSRARRGDAYPLIRYHVPDLAVEQQNTLHCQGIEADPERDVTHLLTQIKKI
jgi:hypothetical protein